MSEPPRSVAGLDDGEVLPVAAAVWLSAGEEAEDKEECAPDVSSQTGALHPANRRARIPIKEQMSRFMIVSLMLSIKINSRSRMDR